jgi:hypothetical protein
MKKAAPAEILAHLYGGRTSRVGEAARGPVQHGLQSLGLHAVGEHDLLNERVRQKVVNCLGASIRHGGVFLSTLAFRFSPRGSLTLQARNGTGRYRSLIPIGNGFVKHHEQRKIECGS